MGGPKKSGQPKTAGAGPASNGEVATQARAEYVTPETKLLSKRRDFYDEKERFEAEKSKFKE
jgi:hypothetical protein